MNAIFQHIILISPLFTQPRLAVKASQLALELSHPLRRGRQHARRIELLLSHAGAETTQSRGRRSLRVQGGLLPLTNRHGHLQPHSAA